MHSNARQLFPLNSTHSQRVRLSSSTLFSLLLSTDFVVRKMIRILYDENMQSAALLMHTQYEISIIYLLKCYVNVLGHCTNLDVLCMSLSKKFWHKNVPKKLIYDSLNLVYDQMGKKVQSTSLHSWAFTTNTLAPQGFASETSIMALSMAPGFFCYLLLNKFYQLLKYLSRNCYYNLFDVNSHMNLTC